MTEGRKAVIVAARRTAVCPRGGALSTLQADELAAPVMRQLLEDAGFPPQRVDRVVLGNALYGGGNPARLAALRAGLPESVPALTLDTQCCSGLDAILLGASLIEAGAADCVIAGGTESFSRAPIRMRRPLAPDEAPVAYVRPAFAPPPFADPDMAQAAADLARERGMTRQAQAEFAVASHEKALAALAHWQSRLAGKAEGLPDRDGFTRALSLKAALRAPVLTGEEATGLSAATIACEADGAAAVLMMASDKLAASARPGVLVAGGLSIGSDPAMPALAPVKVAEDLIRMCGLSSGGIAAVELMEAYAVQARITVEALSLEAARLNSLGGALARGHPIGASGAILAVHLFDRLVSQQTPAASLAESPDHYGLALIAAAGGLGSAMLLKRPV
ncbi:thiolase family protein [Roseibium sp. M-1]